MSVGYQYEQQVFQNAYSDFNRAGRSSGLGSVISGKSSIAKAARRLDKMSKTPIDRFIEALYIAGREEDYKDFNPDIIRDMLSSYKHPEYLHPKVFSIAFNECVIGKKVDTEKFSNPLFLDKLESKEFDPIDVYRYATLIETLFR
jgi:hypothetical protein